MTQKSKLRRRTDKRRGFALIVTVSLLVLLALVAVGLLTLSTVTIRTTQSESGLLEARSNARLALMMAIGELQKQAGPDQRITATAAILGSGSSSDSGIANPHWTGVWDSWAAGNNSDGMPVSHGEDEASEHATIIGVANQGLAANYHPDREDHFRRWLVSLSPEEAGNLAAGKSHHLTGNALPKKNDNAVLLVGRGSLGPDTSTDDHVTGGLTEVNGSGNSKPSGRIGWWVGDESVKAPILPPPPVDPSTLSHVRLADRTQNPTRSDYASVDGLDAIDDPMLDRVVSRRTLGLTSADLSGPPRAFHHATPWSLGVLADVREGGLKRDLNAILDRPISVSDSGDEFMLYRFLDGDQGRVPIQDLSAYYQLYREQLKFGSRVLSGVMQVKVPDFQRETYRRSYSHLYRMVVPVKVQFLLSTIGRRRTPTSQNPDPYKLHIGITPALTLWNPYNVPLTIEPSTLKAIQLRYFSLPIAITWKKGRFKTDPTSIAWITSRETGGGDRYTGVSGWIAGTKPVVFEPGEVRIFSLQNTSLHDIINSNQFKREHELETGWDPNTFLEMTRSTRSSDPRHVHREGGQGGALTFGEGDQIEFEVSAADNTKLANGCAIQFFLRQGILGSSQLGWQDRQFQMMSRLHANSTDFNRVLMQESFPDDLPDPNKIEFPPIGANQLASGQPRPFLMVSLTAGCEVGADVAGREGGRRFASRPFLHSSPTHIGPRIDRTDRDAFYQHGWNWSVTDINSVLEASVQVAANNRSSYYGGGYTGSYGSSHIVQQEIPLVPPASIGGLSHARLGGWSIADRDINEVPPETTSRFETITATGCGGLYPHTLQAIGNSYAHPYIAPDQVKTDWLRKIDEDLAAHEIPLVDHSYLANKALWDEFFFSSLASRSTRLYAGESLPDVSSLAEKVFFKDEPLPNSRLVAIPDSLKRNEFDRYYSGSHVSDLGERAIASHLMISGPFNVNSTSVEAWKAVLGSLREHPIPTLPRSRVMNSGINIDSATPRGVPVSGLSFPSGDVLQGSPADPADPEQWVGWRDLDEEEIEKLAEALVRQVRLRGPFLSLSEFVNRRLDYQNRDLALKGPLQAALDDKQVPINEGFRGGEREFSAADLAEMKPAFREALEGPIAYGSNAYVDQADLLRNFGAVLTPRGDTFVIRTYGDALDANGMVTARAWCEAVVQRTPDYVDPADESYARRSELEKQANELFGRAIRIVSFRWLAPSEV